jgi:CRISPR-associated protein Cas1
MRLERVIAIESACRLRIDTGRLTIERRNQPTAHVALVDIAGLVFDTPQIEITAGLLQACAENDIPVVLTDSKHYAAGLLMPVVAHTGTVNRQRKQATMDENFAGAVWRRIVQAKIRNQARFLYAHGTHQPLARLERLAKEVNHGDRENLEAQAARMYWSALFGRNFKRTKPEAVDTCNAALNYGYAILRSLVSRYLALAGLSPIFGVGHTNAGNPYCLIDDLIEPYRPCVDTLVATSLDLNMPFDSQTKRKVLCLLECEALLRDTRYRLHVGISETVFSFVRALETDRANELLLPDGFTLPL